MTESDWTTCTDAAVMLALLQNRGGVSERKLRLFAVACCRRVWHLLYDGRSRRIVEAGERYADGEGVVERLTGLQTEAVKAAFHAGVDGTEDNDDKWYAAAEAAASVARPYLSLSEVASRAASYATNAQHPEQEAERAAQADVLRCVFGNVFHPTTFTPSWRTDTVVALAAQMYVTRDFSIMPVLADALMDAGCCDEVVLEHCRVTTGHHRGCWVVDMVLEKE